MSHTCKSGTCWRKTVGTGESLRVVVPRQTLTETSRFSYVICTATLCTATFVLASSYCCSLTLGLPFNIADFRALRETSTHLTFSPFIFGVCLITPDTPTQSLSPFGILFPLPSGVSVVGAPMIQPWDTMSLIKADLGLVCVRAYTFLV